MEKLVIEKWDHLVCKTLHPSRLKNVTLDEITISSFLEESKNIKEEVRTYLIRESFLRKSRTENKVLVHQAQSFFTELLDVLFEYQSDTSLPFELQKLYEQVGTELEMIIQFLENSFSHYFNNNARVANFIRSKFEKWIRPHLAKMKKRMAENEKNQYLVESIFGIVESFIQPVPSETMSFHQLIYFKNFVNAASKWKAENFKDRKISAAIELMIALRFNEEAFLNQVYRVLKESMSAIDSEEEQFKLLKEYYKDVSQILETNKPSLFPDQSSAKESVLDWLTQEIYFFETYLPKKENTSTAVSEKINTSLSVPALALFTRLFKDADIISNTNVSEILRFFSSNFTSQRKSSISYIHLQGTYYKIEESTKRKVYDLLMTMAQLCKKLK